MKATGPIVVLALLAACAEMNAMQHSPQSQLRGVGFSTNPADLDRSETALATRYAPQPVTVAAPVPRAALTPDPEPVAIVSAQTAMPEAADPAGTSGGWRFNLFGGSKTEPSDATAVPADVPVASGSSVAKPAPEADIAAAALAALAATPLPGATTDDIGNTQDLPSFAPLPAELRQGGDGPSVVDYALATTHAPGEVLHPRNSTKAGDCSGYDTADFAQIAFLEKGGPAVDPLGLDPDGDGFACAWSPLVLRVSIQRSNVLRGIEHQ